VNLSLSFTAVFLVTCILLGFDFHTAFLIILCVFMIIIDMFGVMYLWHIELNAVSVVNIIMVKNFKKISKIKPMKISFF
jgi:Niemann-Pick C1 protein